MFFTEPVRVPEFRVSTLTEHSFGRANVVSSYILHLLKRVKKFLLQITQLLTLPAKLQYKVLQYKPTAAKKIYRLTNKDKIVALKAGHYNSLRNCPTTIRAFLFMACL